MQKSPKKVFISATSQDLGSYRQVVKDALITAGALPRVQEHFPPDYRELTQFLKDEIRQCDAVICLVGRAFGASPQHQPKDQFRSYSQIEYDEASKLGKSIYVFIATEHCPLDQKPENAKKKNDLQSRHIKMLQAEHKCTPFSSSDELRLRIAEMIPMLPQEILFLKLLGYVAQLKDDPEFSAWNQQRYFELQLGNRRVDFDIGMRLKSPAGGVTPNSKDEYLVTEAVKAFRRLVIIGEPGSGKTTALKRLAITFAEMFEKNAAQGAEVATNVPVYVWLPHFNSVAGDNSVIGTPNERKIVSLIRDSFQEREVLRPADMEVLLENFEMVLLLDGLNEIGDDNIVPFLEGLKEFAGRYKQHLFVITSRTHNSFRTDRELLQFTGGDLPVFELLELSYPDGVEKYISCHLSDPLDVQSLMRKLQSNLQIRLLAVNPLLLLMIITVFKYARGGLPNSRGMLFERSARGLLGEWVMAGEGEDRRPRVYPPDDKHVLLCGLGYAMRNEGLELQTERALEIFDKTLKDHGKWFRCRNTEGLRQLSENRWPKLLDELKSDHVMFQRSDAKVVRFWHQTIQEYFAACYIWNELQPLFKRAQLGRAARRDLERKLEEYIEDSRWHEVLAIVSGLIPTELADEPRTTIDSRSKGQTEADRMMVEEFIDKIWHKDKLLAAMCFNNTERLNDNEDDSHGNKYGKLTEYMKSIQRDISIWGILLPRFYPWLLLVGLLVPIWLIPQQILGSLTNIVRDRSDFADITFQTVGVIIAIVSGGLVSLLFFRLCALGIRRFELLTNEYVIRPGISALRYIRNDEAERLSVQFLERIANDFSIGETTRATIQTGVVLPVRDESELLFMLRSEKTRPQAIKRIFDVESHQGMIQVRQMMERAELDDDLSYATAVKELVSKAKFRPIQDSERESLIKQLTVTVRTNSNYAKRRSAYRGLVDLGVTGVKPPRPRRLVWVVLTIVTLGLLVSLGLLSMRSIFVPSIYDNRKVNSGR